MYERACHCPWADSPPCWELAHSDQGAHTAAAAEGTGPGCHAQGHRGVSLTEAPLAGNDDFYTRTETAKTVTESRLLTEARCRELQSAPAGRKSP